MSTLSLLSIEHLLLRLRPVNRALHAAVQRQAAAAARLTRPDLAPLCITDDQVSTLLGDIDALVCGEDCGARPTALSADEEAEQEALRAQTASVHSPLPLDRLAQELALNPFEEEAILLCAAPEIERSYERIYAYILDDLTRRFPCVELLCTLTAVTLHERLIRRHAVGCFGRLRRAKVLQLHGESPSELRQELRLGPGVLDFLLGDAPEYGLFRDLADVVFDSVNLPPDVDPSRVRQLGVSLGDARVSAVGVWGPRLSGHDEVVRALAAAAKKPLRKLPIADIQQPGADPERGIRESLQAASSLGALLWIPVDPLTEPGSEHLSDLVSHMLVASEVAVCLTGVHPWRPTNLLVARNYAEIGLDAPSYQARKTMWAAALPEISAEDVADFAARFRLGGYEIRAIERVARTRTVLASNGHPGRLADHLEEAVATVARQRSDHFATVVKPKRGPADLILPADLHHQVLEVAHFFRAWPHVAQEWGFGRLASGGGGMKALFTGDSGTGKTLAAEVIAGMLGVQLVKVDLARVVSKWVGETEKNLATAFHEAQDSNAVLFFDEADALFGKRGEVSHGTDRYANLEVSYLLQQLEDHEGLVILASNLKENIDGAFTRRFHVLVHFPRPQQAERRSIWGIAFPAGAPLEAGVDFDTLAGLDMTGAGIVSAARTAALLAVDDGSERITMSHVVAGISRQYRREARVLTRSQLGPYASLLQGT